ncbi:copper homeostasis membrane protein CopD [Luteimonas sp. WGS1318]|uniref:copper homeostasis membrane protein CopD n=1 Tax=Luteimonas sp. WGS1318 TaxID=3366815 RepID=UPI00372D0599
MAEVDLYLVRFAQYLGLAMLFSLPLLQPRERKTGRGRLTLSYAPSWLLTRRILGTVCGLMIAVGIFDLGLKVAVILGISMSEIDVESIRWFLLGSLAGNGWLLRMASLVVLALVLWNGAEGRRTRLSAALLGATALATLAVNGHAASSEGVEGVIRLAVGVIHLLAAAAWLGAILGFLLALRAVWPRRHEIQTLEELRRSLEAFSSTGTLLVAILATTGVVHYIWILDWPLPDASLWAAPYNRWLLLKLVLFAGMLGLAARHRWLIIPKLSDSKSSDVVSKLRQSLWAEAFLAALIIGAVAILGTMSPTA